jgi:hypothetical protein
VDLIDLAEDREKLQALVMNLQVPQNVGSIFTNSEIITFTRTLLHGIKLHE